jgi:uncharacterized phage protein (TIGR01671 family)
MKEIRIIKFRAWDKQRGKMSQWKNLLDYANYVSGGGNEVFKNPDLLLMQFTGITDKDGKEIYEGDIVKQEKWVSVGKYEETISIIKYKGVEFTCECIGEWEGSNADLNGNAEVIGNVWENPELLPNSIT